LNRALTEGSKENLHRRPRRTQRDGGPTRRDRSNIAAARFLDMPRRIARERVPERVPTASNVGSRDVTWASQPTPVIPFGVFWPVSRGRFLRQSGVVIETQFLICLRVLCGLLCSALSTLHWVPVGDGFEKKVGIACPGKGTLFAAFFSH